MTKVQELSTCLPRLPTLLIGAAFALPAAHAIDLIAVGTLADVTDKSAQTALLENGVRTNNALGGTGCGLAWPGLGRAGSNTFIALPDRGPNATVWNGSAAVDRAPLTSPACRPCS